MTATHKLENLGATPVPFSQRFAFHSDAVGAEFLVDVALPAPYLPDRGPWPILFVTDGNMGFATAASTAANLPIEPGGPRPACVVGIGYRLAGNGEKAEHLALRYRDLSPVRDEEWEEAMCAAPPPLQLAKGLETGGGDRFLDFILDELTPWLAANFPVDVEDRTIAGSSLGGALALHAMFTRPSAFARHLAISPSLWWANRYFVGLEETYAEEHSDLATELYMVVGEAEEVQDPTAKMVSSMLSFAAALDSRAYPSLHMKHEVLPEETHVSAFAPAISRGYRHLFGASMPG